MERLHHVEQLYRAHLENQAPHHQSEVEYERVPYERHKGECELGHKLGLDYQIQRIHLKYESLQVEHHKF